MLLLQPYSTTNPVDKPKAKNMYIEERDVHRMFHIDTNRINSRSKLPAMNQLEQWFNNGVIFIEWSRVAQKEAVKGADTLRTEKAQEYVFTETLATTHEDIEQFAKIGTILFPKGISNTNQRNDVEIVFNALKYSGFLITNDGASKSQPGGILGHRKELKALGVTVMSDIETVDYVKNLILQRDQRAIEKAKLSGEPIPDWVGLD